MAPFLNPLGFFLSHLLATSISPNDPTSEIISDTKSLYKSLNNPGPLSFTYSPTVSFSFVAPLQTDNDRSSFSPIRTWNSRPEQTPPPSSPETASVFEKIATDYGTTKPLLLYLPGADGLGISATSQFDSLASTFELWRMIVSSDDRSSFSELVNGVVKIVSELPSHRPLYLVGESFGGLLAPGAALRLSERLTGLVLVNPATSFDESSWDLTGPLLTSLRHFDKEGDGDRPSLYSVLGGVTLSGLIPDRTQFGWIYDALSKTRVTDASDADRVLQSMGEGFRLLSKNLPGETMEHRLTRWLPTGTMVVNPRLKNMKVPTLIVAGREDNLLPTKKEAERLVSVIPNATQVVVPGSGHFVLDGRVNLTKVIVDSPLWEEVKKVKDPITDWEKPNQMVRDLVIEKNVLPLRNLVSPVFFSTDTNGTRKMGLGSVPSENDGPLLFVANHQFGGLDLGLIISELIEKRNIYARGLAHPIIFNSGVEPGLSQPGPNPFKDTDPLRTERIFETFGAVQVTPRNYYRLLETNQSALLFPGGVREVWHGKGEAYKLFWPEDKVDFVRIAARFNATIVPISAVGAAESVNIVIDAPDVVKLPFGLGERAMNSSRNVMSARFDQDNEDELMIPPVFFPKPLPARHYFVFGKAVQTVDVNHRDREACKGVYDEVKGEMNRGFDDLLRARDDDPWGKTGRRILLERATGNSAPTFGLEKLR